ncbi:Slp family lipoprotein [Marinobacterium marinum]|uniref:Slp family lipoprotein n=1 Tax=Marinobacterium marinum TaxID=2756129 RepID=A0A7W2AC23_9GAMM|nr:Slp family lipoprotein [Marinobacterium marinum]MBA4502680.1 Slp family lipoprotein [Marinobacterium marinum]
MKFAFMLLGVLILSGCAALPDDLSVPKGETLLPFAETSETEAMHQVALWGGEIVSVTNLAHGSRLEVVQFSLSGNGRPVKSDSSEGRFHIEVSDFIDPAIYAPGRQVTALGAFSRMQDGVVGQHPYTFPVLKAEQVHLWPEIQQVRERCDCDPFFYSPFMMRPIIVVPNKTE